MCRPLEQHAGSDDSYARLRRRAYQYNFRRCSSTVFLWNGPLHHEVSANYFLWAFPSESGHSCLKDPANVYF